MTIIDQRDIGACDDCGDETEPRRRTLVDETVNGARVRIIVWLCKPCQEHRIRQSLGVEP